MNRQQQRKQLEEALEVMNLDNYLAFASIFAQDIHYPDLKKLIMDYFESLKNYKEYATFVWDMVELSNQLKNEIHLVIYTFLRQTPKQEYKLLTFSLTH